MWVKVVFPVGWASSHSLHPSVRPVPSGYTEGSLSPPLSLACNCSVIQTLVSRSLSAFCLPLRRLENIATDAGAALLQPTHRVYIQQINTNMAGGIRDAARGLNPAATATNITHTHTYIYAHTVQRYTATVTSEIPNSMQSWCHHPDTILQSYSIKCL